jgi:hypothetical protein
MSGTVHIDHVTVRVLCHGEGKEHRLEFSSAVLLLDVLLTGAEAAGVRLLPPGDEPLDRLLAVHEGKVGPAIEQLDEPLDKYLQREGTSHHFAIELLDIFAVNTRWVIAPRPELSPREILSLVGLSHEEYTLYPPHSDHVLPLDVPVKICRGERFEAQKDGKYGCN